MSTVLVVDDEPILREVIARHLERDGHTILEAADGLSARAVLEGSPAGVYPDLVVVDVRLPDLDSLDLCRWIRARSGPPVILLTVRDEQSGRIVGLELGADSYVTSPFSPRELSVSIGLVLRRSRRPVPGEGRLVFGDVALDPATREVAKGGVRVQLTAREFDLLHFLADHPDEVFSRDQLIRRVWGQQAAAGDTGIVPVHVRALREKIEDTPSTPVHLQTIWGVGYRFTP
jgi:DNA-binding response OmpR family regulator